MPQQLVEIHRGSVLDMDAPQKASLSARMFDKGTYVVRDDEFKLVIEQKGGKAELYHLKQDLGETRDIADSASEKLAAMQKLRVEWDAQLVPPAFEGLKTNPKANAAKKSNN